MTDAAVITHGGVIMATLAALGYPKRKAREWVTQAGCGYSVSLSAQLWMRDNIFEVLGRIPVPKQTESEE